MKLKLKDEGLKKLKKDLDKIIIKQKYYICPHCGELTTNSQILKGCGSGGNGMCDCEFDKLVWNDKLNTLDVDTPRLYNQYMPIQKKWYDVLITINNAVLRLEAYRQIPIKER